MVPKMMMADDGDAEALLKICGPLPAAMQSLVREFIERLQIVAADHAAALAAVEAQADARRIETETLSAKNVVLEAAIGALGDQNCALEREVASVRHMNDALIAERRALEAVEAAALRYAEQKRHVDALLEAAGSNAHHRPVSCVPANAVTDGDDAIDAGERLNGTPGDQSSAPPAPNSTAAGSEACGDASGEFAASTSRAGGSAGGRRNSRAPNISS